MTEHVRVVAEDSVLRITLARPEKKNALTNAMYVALGSALERAESDAGIVPYCWTRTAMPSLQAMIWPTLPPLLPALCSART